MQHLTEKEAYLAMFAFLEAHYASAQSEDIGALLGEMALLADGKPTDPAVASQWSKAILDAKSGQVSANLGIKSK